MNQSVKKQSGKGSELSRWLEQTRPRYYGSVQRPSRAWAKKVCHKIARQEGRQQINEGLEEPVVLSRSLGIKLEQRPQAQVVSLNQVRPVIVTRKQSRFIRPVTEVLKLAA